MEFIWRFETLDFVGIVVFASEAGHHLLHTPAGIVAENNAVGRLKAIPQL